MSTPPSRRGSASAAETMIVSAAGALVWRVRQGRIEVALVHRPRYDDWSWPKGKLDPGETWAGAAVREVLEETGLRVRLGIPLPELAYSLAGGATKVVRYWAAEVVGGSGSLDHEVDEVRWLGVDEARRTLTHARDLIPLDALVAAADANELETWPLVVVRHAHAIARAAYRKDDDAKRPLSERGRKRASSLAGFLGAWTPASVVTSSSTRCVQTVKPFAERTDVPLQTKKSLSEETFARKPDKAVRTLTKLLVAGEPVVLCTHRPLIPTLVAQLSEHAETGSTARRTLGRIEAHGMDKGEVLVCQVVGRGATARIVSVERLRTPMTLR